MNIAGMTWGVTLWFDLWAVGLASSAFIAAFIMNRVSGGRRENLFKLSVYTGILFAMTGVILLLSHLGHIEWFWHMFVIVRPSSVLSLGGWILSGWLTVAGIMAVLWILSSLAKGLKPLADKITGFLSWIGFFLSFLLVTYGGVLIATSSQPLWASTLMLPPVFIGSAVASGLGWLILASLIFNWAVGALSGVIKFLFGEASEKIDETALSSLARGLTVALIIELVLVAIFVAWLAIASPDNFSLLVSGQLALYFWAGLVGIGLVLPFLLLLLNRSRAMTGSAVAIAATSSVLSIAGALILRAVILIGGQL